MSEQQETFEAHQAWAKRYMRSCQLEGIHPLRDSAIDALCVLLQAAEQERDRYLNALDRIEGMCGDRNLCVCGRPTGIPALRTCAHRALNPAPTPEVSDA